jgi:hypothetical protein
MMQHDRGRRLLGMELGFVAEFDADAVGAEEVEKLRLVF